MEAYSDLKYWATTLMSKGGFHKLTLKEKKYTIVAAIITVMILLIILLSALVSWYSIIRVHK